MVSMVVFLTTDGSGYVIDQVVNVTGRQQTN